MDKIRKLIERKSRENGLSYKELSLKLGRNHAYIQQFVERGIPRKLKEDDRKKLSSFLGVSEEELGGPKGTLTEDYPSVPEYNILVSAGAGSFVTEEEVRSHWPFNADYLERELRVSQNHLALVEVRGDSMEPTLSSGDRVLVNLHDINISQPGIFVIFDGDGTVVKRLERVYDADRPTIALISDNQIHKRYEVDDDRVKVIGRVIWAAKRF